MPLVDLCSFCSAKISQFTFPVNLFGKKLSCDILHVWYPPGAPLPHVVGIVRRRGDEPTDPKGGVGGGWWGLVGVGVDLIFLVLVAQHCSKQSLNQKAWNEKIHKRKLFILANFCMLVEKSIFEKNRKHISLLLTVAIC